MDIILWKFGGNRVGSI